MTGTGARVFERVVLAVIALNAGVVVAAGVMDGHEEVFEVIHDSILGFFVLELAVHLYLHGWRWFRRPLNALDVSLIVLSLMPAALGADASVLRTARACRLLHLARHLAPQMRLVRFVPCGRLAPVAAACAALLLLVVPAAHFDPDDGTTTAQVCGAFDLGAPPDRIGHSTRSERPRTEHV